jgi:2-oxoglutarate ferredoxin oxidoreductase subunit delta
MIGKIVIDKERCKGCQLCISACPKKLIVLSEDFNEMGYHFVLFDGSEECTGCTMCGRICPDMAIEVYR